MTAKEKTQKIQNLLERNSIKLPFNQVNVLRRAELTLQRWGESECGNSNSYCSWCIERDEKTGKAYRVTVYHKPGIDIRRERVADRETSTLKRVKAICDKAGLIFYHQPDPRGCTLYVGKPEWIDGTDIHSTYSRLLPIC